MRHVSFYGTLLDNSTLTWVSFGFADFSYCSLRGALFFSVNFDFVNFLSARVKDIYIDLVTVYNVNLHVLNQIDSYVQDLLVQNDVYVQVVL